MLIDITERKRAEEAAVADGARNCITA